MATTHTALSGVFDFGYLALGLFTAISPLFDPYQTTKLSLSRMLRSGGPSVRKMQP
jgi:hypothetical protein